VTFDLAARREKADRSWGAVQARLRAIPPQSVGRGFVVLAVLAFVVWLAATSWPALAPYIVGGLIGYTILPLVNRLDGFLPRGVAAILAQLIVLAIIVGFFVIVVPPLLAGLGRLAEALPERGEVTGSLGDLEAWLATLPEPLATVAVDVLNGVVAGLTETLTGIRDGVTQFLIDQTLGILGTVNFVLGLFVLPVWLTWTMTGQRFAKARTLSLVAPDMRPDVQAAIRIVDRSAGSFLRTRVVLALLTSVFTYLGIEVASRLGAPLEANAPVALAALLGVFQLIPSIGLLLGFLPIVLVAAVLGPTQGLLLGAIYVGSEALASRVAEPRGRGGAKDVHPALLIPALVAMSQFGLIWLILAAPVVGIVSDLARYAYGRLGDPPAPAGVIPGEPPTASTATVAPVPSAYRTMAARQGVTTNA
jgi:predicted PurR-regulated permease PerM